MFSTSSYIVSSVLFVSVASLAGVVLLALSTRLLHIILFWLVSFATGAILGNVFFHLLPEALEATQNSERVFLLIFLGILASFVLEKFIHWHHCHHLECDEHSHPVGAIMLVGDGMHNFIDGILIASAYLVDVQLGIATTIAVLLHEIPQEIGDFAVLLHSGLTKAKAILWNFLSALMSLAGAFLVLLLQGSVEHIEMILLPLTAGNFLYIALADLVPALHRESRPGRAILQLLCIVTGASLLYAMVEDEMYATLPATQTDVEVSDEI